MFAQERKGVLLIKDHDFFMTHALAAEEKIDDQTGEAGRYWAVIDCPPANS